ncbi:MAG: type II toxin-antitoxin system Phd/YefM family antitoxin [Candidatus Dormibacteraeota bacterium]|nr:type II toxin-antitoxin system Phd/YefM family antitoxin [Candidatus Dormibacteraeota bacterium]MBO0703921.1 type II toxin-antitoxin system Phd/YefM family antitoxin [Candidatus Dormibacteraeota bacterium]MBO0761107.1 type II toxin-antitoxin system Phd/YefM family antitoxin [Candidatus Dormibacteraeota bacterium]
MVTIPARDLRNDTSGVLRRAQAGEEVVITVRGRPVARLGPLPATERRPMPRAELARRLRTAQADPGLRDDLARLAGDTTDDLESPV